VSLQGENPLEFERSERESCKKFPASVCLRFHHKVETLEKRPHAKFKKTKSSGADAYLLFDWEGWKKVVETRIATEGRRVVP
jgi:hypothetical protein